MSLITVLLVALGGALGTLGRYGLGVAASAVLAGPVGRSLPWGTIGINGVGSFVIGLFGTLTVAAGRYPVSENMRLFVMVGLCGGFTTFSSFSLQTLDLLRAGAVVRAAVNVGGSVALCLAAVTVGHLVAVQMNGR